MPELVEVKLGDVAQVTVGHVGPMASAYVDSGIPFLRSLNVRPHRIDTAELKYIAPEFHEGLLKSALRAGDVVTVRTGKPGQSAVVPEGLGEANCSDLVITRPGPLLDAHWLSYYLNWITDTEIAGHLVGAVQQHFNVRSAQSLVLPLPELGEQRAIAEVLGALDDKIAANQSAAFRADDLIAMHYRWAISRSDAVARPLLDVVDVTYGEAFKGTHFSEAGIGRPLIRIRDLKTSSPQVWTTESRVREKIIQPGDVVVGMDAEFRASWWLGEPGLLNQRVLRATAKQASRAFARECLRRPLAALEGEKSATTVIHLNKSDLERSEVQVPDVESLAHFDAVAEPLRLVRVALALENSRLAATRDELLPLLMSGRIRVKDAEKTVEGVL